MPSDQPQRESGDLVELIVRRSAGYEMLPGMEDWDDGLRSDLLALVARARAEAGHREDSDEGLDPLPPATLAETPFAQLVDRLIAAVDRTRRAEDGIEPYPKPGIVACRTALLAAFAAQARRAEEAERELRRVVQETGGDPETWMGAAEQVRSRMCEYDQMKYEKERAEQRVRDLEAALERVKRHRLFRTMFESAPCILCGYNGPGYYQPDAHPCAKVYHAALRGTGEGSNAPQ